MAAARPVCSFKSFTMSAPAPCGVRGFAGRLLLGMLFAVGLVPALAGCDSELELQPVPIEDDDADRRVATPVSLAIDPNVQLEIRIYFDPASAAGSAAPDEDAGGEARTDEATAPDAAADADAAAAEGEGAAGVDGATAERVMARVQQVVSDRAPGWRVDVEPTPPLPPRTLGVRIAPSQAAPPPPLNATFYPGIRGSAASEIAQLPWVLGLLFSYEVAQDHAGYRKSLELAHAIAESIDGAILDAETTEVFRPALWKAARMEGWSEQDHAAVHRHVRVLQQPGDTEGEVVTRTAGMRRFGLPEIVVGRVPQEIAGGMLQLVMVAAQNLMEASDLPRGEALRVTASGLQHPDAAGVARSILREGAAEEGWLPISMLSSGADGGPAVIELLFNEGTSIAEHQTTAISQLLGSGRLVRDVERFNAYTVARDRAREELMGEVRQRFEAGLEEDQALNVLVPFNVSGGVELLWVELTSWDDEAMEGQVVTPSAVNTELASGASVSFDPERVIDYMLMLDDDQRQGGEVQRLIRQNAARSPAPVGPPRGPVAPTPTPTTQPGAAPGGDPPPATRPGPATAPGAEAGDGQVDADAPRGDAAPPFDPANPGQAGAGESAGDPFFE